MLAPRAKLQVVHGHENAALRRFEAVAHVRQSAIHDRAHGIGEIAFLEFLLDLEIGDAGVVHGHRAPFEESSDRHGLLRRRAANGPGIAATTGKGSVLLRCAPVEPARQQNLLKRPRRVFCREIIGQTRSSVTLLILAETAPVCDRSRGAEEEFRRAEC